MRCIICGERAGFNRAVIELFSGARIGRLCMNCEKAEFGNSLRHEATSETRQCNFCERDGQVLFPRYVPETERNGNDIVVKSSIEECAAVPCLCDEHFHELIDDPREPRRVTL